MNVLWHRETLNCSTHTLNVCHRGLMPSCHTSEWCLYCCCRQTCCSCWGGTLQLWSPLSAPPCWQAWYLQYLQQLVKELPPVKWVFPKVFFSSRCFQKCCFRLVGPGTTQVRVKIKPHNLATTQGGNITFCTGFKIILTAAKTCFSFAPLQQ